MIHVYTAIKSVRLGGRVVPEGSRGIQSYDLGVYLVDAAMEGFGCDMFISRLATRIRAACRTDAMWISLMIWKFLMYYRI